MRVCLVKWNKYRAIGFKFSKGTKYTHLEVDLWLFTLDVSNHKYSNDSFFEYIKEEKI